MAITQPGMFLSQPGIEIFASYHCADITVSMESAIRSRDCNENDMPSVPIEMPSLTPMVLNRIPTRPDCVTPSLTNSASLLRCMLQVLPSYQTLAMPTWALFISSRVSPSAIQHGLRGALGPWLRDARTVFIEHDVWLVG